MEKLRTNSLKNQFGIESCPRICSNERAKIPFRKNFILTNITNSLIIFAKKNSVLILSKKSIYQTILINKFYNKHSLKALLFKNGIRRVSNSHWELHFVIRRQRPVRKWRLRSSICWALDQ